MPQDAVSFVIHALLTDQNLRERFAMSPMEVLVDLHLSADIELTLDELEALVRASRDVWCPTRRLRHGLVH